MNREQWLKKRSHLESNVITSAFDARHLDGLAVVQGAPGDPAQAFAAIREQHFDDGLACDDWALRARAPKDSH